MTGLVAGSSRLSVGTGKSGSGGMERPFWRGCAWNTEFPANPVAMRDAGRAACTTEINVSACPIRLRERESFGAFLYDFVALSGRSFPVSYSVRTVDFPSLRAWPRFRYDFYGGVRVVKPFAYGREYRRENSGRHAGRADLSAHFGQDADGPADAARFGQCFRARGAGRRVDIQSGNVGLVSGARARRVDRFQHADSLPAALQAPETPDQGRYGDDRSGRST